MGRLNNKSLPIYSLGSDSPEDLIRTGVTFSSLIQIDTDV